MNLGQIKNYNSCSTKYGLIGFWQDEINNNKFAVVIIISEFAFFRFRSNNDRVCTGVDERIKKQSNYIYI